MAATRNGKYNPGLPIFEPPGEFYWSHTTNSFLSSLLRLVLLRDFDEGGSIDVEITIHGHAQTYNFKAQEFGYGIVYG